MGTSNLLASDHAAAMPTSKTLDDHRLRIARAIEHLETHLDGPLDVSGLAAVACLSEFHFHRVFRALVGESVMSHVRRLRLERAARTLRSSERKVIDIALEAGFDSHEAFTRAFTAHFGASPSGYRRAQVRAPGEGEAASPPTAFARMETRASMTLLALRHVGPYSAVGATWSALFREAGSHGIAGAPYGICHDDPEVTDPSRFRYDACLALQAPVQPWGEVRLHTIEPGPYVVALHRGSYSELAATYGQLTRWALDRDLLLAPDGSIERYLNVPGAVPETDLRTEIAMRVL